MPAELATVTQINPPAVVTEESAAFDLLQRRGKMLSSSQLVPDVYRGKVADCCLIAEIAGRIGASPLLVANNLDIIHGRPSWRAQFLIASVNQSGRFSSLRYEFDGEGKERRCRAWAIERATGDRLEGVWISWRMAETEGWTKKAGSKWQTMPDQMFVYRAAAFWTRAYAPEIALGFPTDDEVRDIIDITPTHDARNVIATLNAEIAQAAPPKAPEPAEIAPQTPDPAPTYAQVREAIDSAADADSMALARDLINGVEPQFRAELVALADSKGFALA